MDMPVVFISSTQEDLIPYREQVREAVHKAKCFPEMMEYFEAGQYKPLTTCLEKVRGCDVLIVVVAHRYGWVPEEQEPNGCRVLR